MFAVPSVAVESGHRARPSAAVILRGIAGCFEGGFAQVSRGVVESLQRSQRSWRHVAVVAFLDDTSWPRTTQVRNGTDAYTLRTAMRCLALLYCIVHAAEDEIVSIVTTAEEFPKEAPRPAPGPTTCTTPAPSTPLPSTTWRRPCRCWKKLSRIFPEMPEALINLGNFYGDLSGDGKWT